MREQLVGCAEGPTRGRCQVAPVASTEVIELPYVAWGARREAAPRTKTASSHSSFPGCSAPLRSELLSAQRSCCQGEPCAASPQPPRLSACVVTAHAAQGGLRTQRRVDLLLLDRRLEDVASATRRWPAGARAGCRKDSHSAARLPGSGARRTWRQNWTMSCTMSSWV